MRRSLFRIVRRTGSKAFTLVELLVVVAIIGTLVGLLLPAISSVKESSRRTQCLDNLHQIGTALQSYDTQHGSLPVGCVERAKRRIAWSAYLLADLDEKPAFSRFHFDQKYNAAENREATSTIVGVYLCPSTTRYAAGRVGDTTGDRNGNGQYDPGDFMACTDYGGMFGSANVFPGQNGVFIFDRGIKAGEITDGLQWTIAVAEDSGRGAQHDGEWANGENIFDVGGRINALQDNEIWSDHPGGACVVFCDSRAKFLSEILSPTVLSKLCTRAGKEVVSGEEVISN